MSRSYRRSGGRCCFESARRYDLRSSASCWPQVLETAVSQRGVRSLSTVLDEIIEHKLKEVASAKAKTPFEELQSQLADAPPVRSFYKALSWAPTRD